MSPIRHLQNYDTKRGTPAENQDASIDNMNKHTNHMNMTDTPTTPYYNATPSEVNDNVPEIVDASAAYPNDGIVRELPLLGLFTSQPQCLAQVNNTSFATEPAIISYENAWDLFRYDHTTISFNGGRCHGDNFAYATAIPFDIDNSHSDNPEDWITPEQLQERLQQLGIIYWMVASRNHLLMKNGKAARPKFHVYLPLALSLQDSGKFVQYCEWCIKTFNADTQVKSKAQKIFGYGDNPDPFIHFSKGGRCVDEVLTDDDLASVVTFAVPAQDQAAVVCPPQEGDEFEWFIKSGEWYHHLGDLETLGWKFLEEKNGQLFFQTPEGDHLSGKQDGNIKDGVAYIFSRAPAPFEEGKGYSICQLFAGALFGDISNKGLAQFAERYLPHPQTQWQPFPVEVFPDQTKRFIQETADAIGIDTAFIAPVLLSAFSGLIGRSCRIQLKKGYSEIPSIWVAIVASSGTGKTPGLDAVLTPIREHQQQEDEKYKEALLEYEARKQENARQKDGGSNKKLTAPTPNQLLMDDVTTEAVVEILEQNPHGCLLFQDELSSFLGSFDAYRSGGGGKDLGFWLSVFNGVPVRVNRKTGKKLISAHTPAVAICGGIQPGMVRRILSKNEHFFDAGLMARVLTVSPPLLPVLWSEKVVAAETERGYRDLVKRLLVLRRAVNSLPDKPIVVTLSKEAKEVWSEFYNHNAAGQHTLDTEAERAAFAKLPAYAARIALVLHVVEDLESGRYDISRSDWYSIPTEVSVETLLAAIRLVEWFKMESMRLLASFRNHQQMSLNPEMSAIRDAIQNKDVITKRELHNLRIFRGHPSASGVIDASLTKLRNMGLIESHFVKSPLGGYGKEVFRLSTGISDSTTPENPGEYEGNTVAVSESVFASSPEAAGGSEMMTDSTTCESASEYRGGAVAVNEHDTVCASQP